MNSGCVKKIVTISVSAVILGCVGMLMFPEIVSPVSAESVPTISNTNTSAISLKSTGEVNLHLETVPYTNVVRAGMDPVTPEVSSNNVNLFLYLSTDSTTSNSLVHENGIDTIPATSASLATGQAAKLTGNSWGFALNNTTPGLPTGTGFIANYESETLPRVPSDSTWAAVPMKHQEQLIRTYNNISAGQTIDPTNIYYAVSAKDDLTEGNYSGTVVYTAIAEPATAPSAELNKYEGTAGDEIIITTDGATDLDAESLGAATVNFTSTTTNTVTPCDNPQVSKNTNNHIVVTCNVPELPASGDYTVTTSLNKTGTTYTGDKPFIYTAPGPTPGSTPCTDTAPYLDGLEYLQDFNPSVHKNNMVLNKQYKAKDRRDGKEYCFAKLKNNPAGTETNVWMTDNLRLGNNKAQSEDSIILRPEDSNIEAGTTFTLPAAGTTDSDTWMGFYDAIEYYPSDDIQEDATKGAVGYYGYYYNWNAATAGTGDKTYMEAQYDICPKGWSLPSDYSTDEGKTRSYSALLYAYDIIASIEGTGYVDATTGFTKMTTSPLQLVLAGGHNYTGTPVSGRGTNGYYWSSSSFSVLNTMAHYLDFSSSNVRPSMRIDKRKGVVIRCLAQ